MKKENLKAFTLKYQKMPIIWLKSLCFWLIKAEFIGKQKKTFIYRIHDEPNADKLVYRRLSQFGYKIDLEVKMIFRSHWIVYWVKSSVKEQNLVDTLTIRTMSKAKYLLITYGHYGLAFDYYSHFTSPYSSLSWRYGTPFATYFLMVEIPDEEIYEAKCLHSYNGRTSD
jgi:ribonuclease R